jgi:transposase-like protein
MATKKKAAKKKERKTYTEEQRAAILKDAEENKLTAAQVSEKHGVAAVTYYSWRKKGKEPKKGKKKRAKKATDVSNLGESLRALVREVVVEQIQEYMADRFQN